MTPSNQTSVSPDHPSTPANRSWDAYLETILGPKNRDDWLSIALASIYVLIFATGLVGNTCTCYVIARNRRMRTVTNCYLFSLAVADILTLLLGLPPEFYSIFEAYPWRFGSAYCLLKTFMTETTSSASILTITCFTVERYMAICHSLKMQTMPGMRRAVKNIAVIWIGAMLSALPYPLHTRVFPYIRDEEGRPIENAIICNIPENWRNRMANVFQASTFLLFVLPMLVITALYVRIGMTLRKAEGGVGNRAGKIRPPSDSCLSRCRPSACCLRNNRRGVDAVEPTRNDDRGFGSRKSKWRSCCSGLRPRRVSNDMSLDSLGRRASSVGKRQDFLAAATPPLAFPDRAQKSNDSAAPVANDRLRFLEEASVTADGSDTNEFCRESRDCFPAEERIISTPRPVGGRKPPLLPASQPTSSTLLPLAAADAVEVESKVLENTRVHPEDRIEHQRRATTSGIGEGCVRNRFKVKIQARPRRSVLKMLVAVVVAFFICWAPFHVQRLMTVYDQGVVDSAWIDLQNALFFVSGILYFVNCTVNPILYSLLSLNFKQAFSATLGCRHKTSEENARRIELDDHSKSYFRCRISGPNFCQSSFVFQTGAAGSPSIGQYLDVRK